MLSIGAKFQLESLLSRTCSFSAMPVDLFLIRKEIERWHERFVDEFSCFCVYVSVQDSEENDGSPDKPYYMSRDLMEILGKKNKIWNNYHYYHL